MAKGQTPTRNKQKNANLDPPSFQLPPDFFIQPKDGNTNSNCPQRSDRYELFSVRVPSQFDVRSMNGLSVPLQFDQNGDDPMCSFRVVDDDDIGRKYGLVVGHRSESANFRILVGKNDQGDDDDDDDSRYEMKPLPLKFDRHINLVELPPDKSEDNNKNPLPSKMRIAYSHIPQAKNLKRRFRPAGRNAPDDIVSATVKRYAGPATSFAGALESASAGEMGVEERIVKGEEELVRVKEEGKNEDDNEQTTKQEPKEEMESANVADTSSASLFVAVLPFGGQMDREEGGDMEKTTKLEPKEEMENTPMEVEPRENDSSPSSPSAGTFPFSNTRMTSNKNREEQNEQNVEDKEKKESEAVTESDCGDIITPKKKLSFSPTEEEKKSGSLLDKNDNVELKELSSKKKKTKEEKKARREKRKVMREEKQARKEEKKARKEKKRKKRLSQE